MAKSKGTLTRLRAVNRLNGEIAKAGIKADAAEGMDLINRIVTDSLRCFAEMEVERTKALAAMLAPIQEPA